MTDHCLNCYRLRVALEESSLVVANLCDELERVRQSAAVVSIRGNLPQGRDTLTLDASFSDRASSSPLHSPTNAKPPNVNPSRERKKKTRDVGASRRPAGPRRS